uniref:N-alpha-acetyltransferase 60, NatF catalytic subunit n=1 Tax=Sus scrofa TaxID=9823 RepID=A0A8D0QR68_PIG
MAAVASRGARPHVGAGGQWGSGLRRRPGAGGGSASGRRLRPGCGPCQLHNSLWGPRGPTSWLPANRGCAEPRNAVRCRWLPPEVWMTEVVPSSALSEVSLRLLCHDDIDTVKHLCGDWFPIELFQPSFPPWKSSLPRALVPPRVCAGPGGLVWLSSLWSVSSAGPGARAQEEASFPVPLMASSPPLPVPSSSFLQSWSKLLEERHSSALHRLGPKGTGASG